MYILLQREALWSEKKYICDSRGTLNVKSHTGAKSFSEIAFSPLKGGPFRPTWLHFLCQRGLWLKRPFHFSFFRSLLRVSGSATSPACTSQLLLICFWLFSSSPFLSASHSSASGLSVLWQRRVAALPTARGQWCHANNQSSQQWRISSPRHCSSSSHSLLWVRYNDAECLFAEAVFYNSSF